jgi:hypothetical protein
MRLTIAAVPVIAVALFSVSSSPAFSQTRPFEQRAKDI